MDSADRLTLDTVLGWLTAGDRVMLATVARTWGSAPRQPGAWAAVRADGAVVGSVSGGCIEADLIARVRSGELLSGPVRALRYGETPEEAARFGLPCGGKLEIVVEPAPQRDALEALRQRLAARLPSRRVLDVASGLSTVEAAAADVAFGWDGARLLVPHGPRLRLLIIGAGQISLHLAHLALMLDYEVLVCDPREEYRTAWNVAGARLVDGMPDDAVTALAPDARTAVVALTHDPKLDDLALLEALASPAFYVGALGSFRSNQRRRERLREHFAVDAAALARLRGPVGFRIGSRTPAEIALAVAAEMTAAKNGIALAPAGTAEKVMQSGIHPDGAGDAPKEVPLGDTVPCAA
ncbi:XdhC family protein [Sulfurisoma sediminicola]|uniref:Xanthine dehydrogenase accessory factor n=1 Tax=Sulfurisoma sediminicola TaxID=1381557 RepID=A0A497XCL2_9PROT|nr:XdhC family protein [Sulfurisoma sediminicola]RLJ64663.1 xanthine dehydrogenase accessory factor [Sulfurisoma sediminicola]